VRPVPGGRAVTAAPVPAGGARMRKRRMKNF
jgi:hypothetical protein